MTQPRHIVLYDSDCPLCTFQMRMLTWLDWLNKAELVPIKDPRSAKIAPSVGREDLQEAIHAITPQGAMHRGARAIRFLSMRLPLALPLGLFLWIPGIIWIAEKVYMWISRNRLFFSKIFGCKGACAILPERKRETPSSTPES